MFGYDLPPDEALEWSRFLNEHMLKAVSGVPFFIPLATVPMQSGKLAARVLEEALDQGFHGAMIGTQPKGAAGVLDDPDLEPFWKAASSRKATLFVHPTFGARDDRLKAYGLVSAVGRVQIHNSDRAPFVLGPSASPSGRQSNHITWRRRSPDGTRAPPAKLRNKSRPEFRSSGRIPQALFRFHCLRRGHFAFHMRHRRCGPCPYGNGRPVRHSRAGPVKLINSCNFALADRQAILGGTAARLFDVGDGSV